MSYSRENVRKSLKNRSNERKARSCVNVSFIVLSICFSAALNRQEMLMLRKERENDNNQNKERKGNLYDNLKCLNTERYAILEENSMTCRLIHL